VSAPTGIYVQAGVYDAFVEKLVAKTRELKVGDGREDGVAQGPLIDSRRGRQGRGASGRRQGQGRYGRAGWIAAPAGRHFFQPTVLTGATQDMAFATEEIFGPLAPVFRFETEDEAIEMANATVFGLASYVYTRDLGRAFRLNDALQYGMIGINSGLITTVEAPFGGVKESGMGKEGGSQGLDDYLDTKYVCIDGI
jgi:succinate-semialdehyde dehydrogenase/glutarate-semialdehyde dehydrogenase